MTTVAETNHSALGRGLKFYTSAMRGLIEDRLTAVFRSHWWEYGVMESLTQVQRSNLTRDLNKKPAMDRLDLIDAKPPGQDRHQELRPRL